MTDKPKTTWRRLLFIGALVLVGLLAAGAVTAAVLHNQGATTNSPPPSGPSADAGAGAGAGADSVKTVRPKLDPDFKVIASNPGYVNAYYRVDLEAQVPGVVEKLTKDIGDPVKKGEEVLKLSVPDLAADVKVKDAIIADKRDELTVAQSQKELADAAIKAAQAVVKEMTENVVVAADDAEYRATRARRFETLVGESAAIKDVASETLAESKKAQAAVVGAQASVERAQTEVAEATAKLGAARADLKLQQAEIDQAIAERDKAQAMLDFASLKAPFDGVVVRRLVDPGSFVSNSSAGHSDALLTLERTDILTVVGNFPDVYAPYINNGTEVLLEMSELPGVVIHGKVTRYAPTLQTASSDRTMRVEVDLYNGSAEEYQKFMKTTAVTREGLKGGELPLFPAVTVTSGSKKVQLLPGMYGDMKLVLKNFKNAELLPSSAVFSRGGVRYVFLVRDGKAVLTHVDVQAENGTLDKVLVSETKDGEEVWRELLPTDEVVNSNQGELRDGQEIKTVPVEW